MSFLEALPNLEIVNETRILIMNQTAKRAVRIIQLMNIKTESQHLPQQ